jgi:hypothetical protein
MAEERNKVLPSGGKPASKKTGPPIVPEAPAAGPESVAHTLNPAAILLYRITVIRIFGPAGQAKHAPTICPFHRENKCLQAFSSVHHMLVLFFLCETIC